MQFPKKSILDLAVNMAMRSEYDHRLGAVIFRSKKILSVGFNQVHVQRRKLHPKFVNYRYNLHAEASSILNARCDLKGCEIVVVRINRKGELRLAKSCDNCLNYLEYVQMKRVWYSTGIGNEFEVIKL